MPLYCSIIRRGLQLSVVRKKLNVVADGGRRKLSVVADGTPEKGRRYSTFIYTDLLTKVLPKAASGLASKPWQKGLGTRQTPR